MSNRSGILQCKFAYFNFVRYIFFHKSLNVGSSNATNKTNIAKSMNEYFISMEPDLATRVPVIDIELESYVDSSESAFIFKSINIDEVE